MAFTKRTRTDRPMTRRERMLAAETVWKAEQQKKPASWELIETGFGGLPMSMLRNQLYC